MNPTNLIESLVSPFVQGFVTLARMESPSSSDADVTAKVDGDVKHLLRSRIGFAVDLLWGYPAFQADADALIARVVAATPAAPFASLQGGNTA